MAVRFDASGDSLSRTTNLPPITTFTMMGWFLLSADRNANSAALTFGSATTSTYYYIGTASDGTTLRIYNPADNNTGAALSLNTWYHLAAVCAGSGASQYTGYLNGALAITVNGGPTVTAVSLWVGNNVNTDWLNGRAAAIKVWSVALTAEEILREIWCYLPIKLDNLLSWHPLMLHTDLAQYGTAWTVGGTLATEAGPPIAWSLRPSWPQSWLPVVSAGILRQMVLHHGG